MECTAFDLSKKRVSPEDAQKAEEWYAKSKAVHSIMRHVSSQTEVPVQELCQKIAWPLYKKYPHALDGLKTMVSEEGALADLNLSKEVFEALLTGVRRRLTPQACKLRGRVEVQCFEREDGLKVLDEAIKLIKEDIEAAGGQFTLKTKPEVVGDNDELGVGDLAGKGDDDDSP